MLKKKKKMMNQKKISSSFRDPSGFLFTRDGRLLRQINKIYADEYKLLISSGLYKNLTNKNLLIPHQEIDSPEFYSELGYKIIEPQKINIISYPYEWAFSQLKDAALLTLQIQKIALEHNMSLKDASAYNIQFLNGQAIFIDTLSFEKYKEGEPWPAYRQFCQHFLAPLALIAYKDLNLSQLSRLFIDGIDLTLASKLLPISSKLNFSILTHIHLHAKSQKHYADKKIKSQRKISKQAILALIDSLESTVKKLKFPHTDTEWGEYYSFTNYSNKAFDYKKELVEEFLAYLKPSNVWDLGGNTGIFSRLASDKNIPTICFDIDLIAVEKNYLYTKKNKEENILPLFLDLTNPSPNIGWGNQERDSWQNRGPADTLMALALIHHLAISNNLPFDKIANYFSQLGNNLIIEFVPKGDSKVNKLLATREDIFDKYTKEDFEKEFSQYFEIKKTKNIAESKRTLYLMVKK
jgi:hypothetical protein